MKFYNDSKRFLVPVKMELVVGDRDYGIGEWSIVFSTTKSPRC